MGPGPARRLATILAPVLALAAAAAPAPAGPARRVVLVSFDALRPDAISSLGPEGAPAFHRMRREGAGTLNARTDPDFTVTLPDHACMLTGRGVLGASGHRVRENYDTQRTIHEGAGRYVASALDVVHDRGLRTAFFASKDKFDIYLDSWDADSGAPDRTGEDNGRAKVDASAIHHADDDATLEALRRELGGHRPTFAFAHFGGLDRVGHARGWDVRRGSDYAEEVRRQDRRLAAILDAVGGDAELSGSTAVIVTADHGGRGHGHSDPAVPEDYTIPFLAWGAGVAAGADLYALNPSTRTDPGKGQVGYGEARQPIRNGDAANLALGLLRLPPVPGSTINARQDLRVAPGPAADGGSDAPAR